MSLVIQMKKLRKLVLTRAIASSDSELVDSADGLQLQAVEHAGTCIRTAFQEQDRDVEVQVHLLPD